MQSIKPNRSLVKHLASLYVARCPLKRRLILLDMSVSASPAILYGYGARGWAANAEFGRSNLAWLKRSLMLPHLVPSENNPSDEIVEVEEAIIDAEAIDDVELRAAIDAHDPGHWLRTRRCCRTLGRIDGPLNRAAPEQLDMLGMVEPTAAVTAKRSTRRTIRSAVSASPTSACPPAGMSPVWTSR